MDYNQTVCIRREKFQVEAFSSVELQIQKSQKNIHLVLKRKNYALERVIDHWISILIFIHFGISV